MAGLALVPRLPLLLGRTSLHSRGETDATCLEENDGVRGRANVAVVSLHCAQAVSRICFKRMLFSQRHRRSLPSEAAYGRSRGDCCRKDRIQRGGINGLMEENRTQCSMSGANKCEPRNGGSSRSKSHTEARSELTPLTLHALGAHTRSFPLSQTHARNPLSPPSTTTPQPATRDPRLLG
jgi:hypothetical protein